MQKLINAVQNYAWGSHTALTELYGIANPDNLPMAELWMGAHPKSSSQILTADGQPRSLREVIDADKAALLGDKVAQRFGELPFLFKVLCAAQPLSIQVHPNKQASERVSPKRTPPASRSPPPNVTTKIRTTSRSWFSP
jgi:mannose-6-phosphate isomerase